LKRERYLDYLANLRLSLAKSGAEARTIANLIHPEPGLLPQMIADPTRLWERRPSDSDFLQVRIGQGTTLWSPLVADTDPDPAQGFDPVLMAEAAEAIRTAGLVDAMPICLDLGLGSGEIALIGPREATENLARALVAQLACFHSPADVGIVVVGEQAPAWPGLDRLPHYQTPSVNDLMSLLTREVSTRPPHAAKGLGWLPHLVIIVDEHGRSAQPFPKADLGATELGITVIHLIDHPLDGPSEQAAVVTVDANHQIGFEPVGEPAQAGQADLVSTGFFEALTRSLAPYSLEEAHGL
jgi:S-DNA-T family DNA segregation ATPase FtsK/SpoIIIE